MKIAPIFLAVLLLAAPAVAKAPDLHVSGYATGGLGSSAAYVTVQNGGRFADRLLGASSGAATSVTIHDSSNVGGVMRMRPAGPIALAPGRQVAMRPGGTHIMLMGLKAPLRPGTKLPLTLRFAKAGAITVSLPIVPPGSGAPASGTHHGL